MAAAAMDTERPWSIEEMTSNVDSVQERVLAEILAHNAGTEYLRKCGLPTDRAAFRANVPVVSYDDLKPYIQRIANGDRSPILSSHPVTDLITSSGTSSGECKLVPNSNDAGGRLRCLQSLLMPMMNSHFPGLDKGKALYFLFVRPETKTAGGLTVWPLLTRTYKSEKFRNRLSGDPFHDYTSPMAAILCPDTLQSMYAQMVCGLCQRHDVLRIGALFATTLLRAIRFLQLNWEELAADIEAGALGPRVTDESLRQAVAGILRPDPELARFVRDECGAGEWTGIVSRIWPNTRYLEAVVTGAIAQYVPALSHYGGDLPIVSLSYASSECYFGVNLQPLCDPSEVSYTIMPNLAYFEFLPVGAAADAGQLVDLIYWELLPLSAGAGAGAGAAVDRETLDGCCVEMEQALSTVYRRSRVGDGSVGPLEIRVVRPGIFEELMDYAISRGASINQYKAPRCVPLPPAIQLLDTRVVSVHYSTAAA